jgi:hypothetical protein
MMMMIKTIQYECMCNVDDALATKFRQLPQRSKRFQPVVLTSPVLVPPYLESKPRFTLPLSLPRHTLR